MSAAPPSVQDPAWLHLGAARAPRPLASPSAGAARVAEALVIPWGRPNGYLMGLGAPVVRDALRYVPPAKGELRCGVRHGATGSPGGGGRSRGTRMGVGHMAMWERLLNE